jgi:predicted regulator of Ras-like GTPase activity (Roadblock/LC7/MglB family)
MSEIEHEIQTRMMQLLKVEEAKTDLDNLSVLSRVGMKVASATSDELDADATSASTTALIDLGLRLSDATAHGALLEIILHNTAGYSILMAISDEYVVFGGLKNAHRIGYYLGYVRELAKKLKILISGDEISEMALKLEESQLAQIKQQEVEAEALAAAAVPLVPSVEQDKEALGELLGFLDEWEKEGMDLEELDLDVGAETNIVSIPKSIAAGIPQSTEIDEMELPEFDELEISTEVGLPTSSAPAKSVAPKSVSGFKVYDGEVPPIPLEDYTPMDVEEAAADGVEYAEEVVQAETSESPYAYESFDESEVEELPPLDELPSFAELDSPNFDSFDGTEYDTEFVLEEEGEALDSVLKDLGWEEEG